MSLLLLIRHVGSWLTAHSSIWYIKKEGRHPDDQSSNFKNLIPWKTQCKGTAILRISKCERWKKCKNNTFCSFFIDFENFLLDFVSLAWQSRACRTIVVVIMLKTMYVFRSMDDYHTSRRGRGVLSPLPRLLRIVARRRKTFLLFSQILNFCVTLKSLYIILGIYIIQTIWIKHWNGR